MVSQVSVIEEDWMSSVIPRIVMAVAMVTLGWLCWRAGRIEGRMAEADRELATLRYAPPLQAYDETDDSVGSLDRMLQAVLGRSSDAERRRATARYWLAEFDTLLPARDVDGQPVHDDPVRLLVGANAVYRATVRAGGEPEAMADRLQDATDAYADVLRADPTQVDAAYNYEFVARLRDALARGRQPPPARPDAAQSGTGPDGPRDPERRAPGLLPVGPTLHGWPGAPPPAMTSDQLDDPFRVYVPLRPTERKESNEAGKGPLRPRKG